MNKIYKVPLTADERRELIEVVSDGEGDGVYEAAGDSPHAEARQLVRRSGD